MMKPRSLLCPECVALCVVFAVLVLCGCSDVAPSSLPRAEGPDDLPSVSADRPATTEQKVFDPRESSPEQGQAFLSELGLDAAGPRPIADMSERTAPEGRNPRGEERGKNFTPPEPVPGPAPQTVTASAEPSSLEAPASETPTGTSPGVEPNAPEVHAVASDSEQTPSQGRVVLQPAPEPTETASPCEVALTNGDDVLQLDLADPMELSQLLDLAAQYLHIDYLYEPEKIRGQSVSLRLHGKLQGEIRVKDLYPLLESVLQFKGFAMTRHKSNVVTIVPLAEVLQADPRLVDPNGTSLKAGDTVVTRVFKLQHVNATSAVNLLNSMKLSAAALAIEETGSLIVTCYAQRMVRIERLLDMVDRPGRLREFRFRQLQHTRAGTLGKKVQAIVAELQGVPVQIAPPETAAPTPRLPLVPSPLVAPRLPEGVPADAPDRRAVYLDADEATNRILMVGGAEQLAIVEKVIEALDVEQQDQRTFRVYEITHVDADDVKKQLVTFHLIDDEEARGGTSVPRRAAATVAEPGAAEAPSTGSEGRIARRTNRAGESGAADSEKPQASVLSSSNSLLVNATPVQHARIAGVIGYVDTAARQGAIPYEIYFLENQEPEHLAEVLQKLLKEIVVSKEDKTEKVVRRTEEEIVIVPDKNTFALIVYANKRNQDWICKLVKTLDRRRPQVLIDATLVEVTKTDAFTYDLNLLGSLPNVAATAAISQADPAVVGKLVQSDKGLLTAFYGDEHIQALLQAMQTKNYGRVLAKPKILVNDNEPGKIKTTDVTYVETTSSIPITSGAAGSQTNLVQTAVKYDPYEAGITLDITPHISDGDLLRLDVSLTRSDFLETADPKKPPNKRSNEVNTKVTVPDGSTIILGGLLKLNQNKGGTKVPILGDLPLIGLLFRGINNKDTQNKLYVFVKAEIIRPKEQAGRGMDELTAISERDRQAFETHEREFQHYEDWPGLKSQPVAPSRVLDAR